MDTTLYDPTVPAIDRFAGRWFFLSNFQPAVFDLEGIRWSSTEAAFNGLKTLDPEQRAWVAAAGSPAEAKRRGRRVTLRPRWDQDIRFRVMADVLEAKFTAHPARRDALLSTGTAELVEGTTWHDQTWGNCTCGRPACARPGLNHLGRLLMELRVDLGGTS